MITLKDIEKVTSIAKSSIRTDNGDQVLKEILEDIKPKFVVEIGTYKGIAALYMSQFCKRVYTVDLLDGKLEGEEKSKTPIRTKLWEHFGVENIWFQPVKCNHSKERFLKKIDFDFAFVDGDHSYEGAEYDFGLVKRCGRVLFHDYSKSKAEKRNGVYNFVNTLPKEQITVKGIFAYWQGPQK